MVGKRFWPFSPLLSGICTAFISNASTNPCSLGKWAKMSCFMSTRWNWQISKLDWQTDRLNPLRSVNGREFIFQLQVYLRSLCLAEFMDLSTRKRQRSQPRNDKYPQWLSLSLK